MEIRKKEEEERVARGTKVTRQGQEKLKEEDAKRKAEQGRF